MILVREVLQRRLPFDSTLRIYNPGSTGTLLHGHTAWSRIIRAFSWQRHEWALTERAGLPLTTHAQAHTHFVTHVCAMECRPLQSTIGAIGVPRSAGAARTGVYELWTRGKNKEVSLQL